MKVKTLYNLTLTIISIFIFYSCKTENEMAEEQYKKAYLSFMNEDYGDANEKITKAIALVQDNQDYYLLSARIKMDSKRFEESIAILSNLNDSGFKKDTVNFYLGKAYFAFSIEEYEKTGNKNVKKDYLKKSIPFLDYTLNQDIQFYKAYIYKFKALHNLGDYSNAINTINNGLKIFPDSISLINYRGIEKVFLGDLIGAQTDINLSINSQKLDLFNLAESYRFRGLIYTKLDSIKLAIEDLSTSISYDSNNATTFINRADLFRHQNEINKACKDYRKAADLGAISAFEEIKKYCN